MSIITPEPTFFEIIEERSNGNGLSLLDTGMFRPCIYDERSALKKRELVGMLRKQCHKSQQLRDFKSRFIPYMGDYFEKLERLLVENSNITTTTRVVEELKNSKEYCDRSAVLSRRAAKSYGNQSARNRALFMASIEKANSKSLSASLKILEEKGIFDEDSAYNDKLYFRILSTIEQLSEEEGLDMGPLHTDQHLLADAVYHSIRKSQPARIFTHDRHIIRLLSCGWQNILGSFQTKQNPNVAVYRIVLRKGKYLAQVAKTYKGKLTQFVERSNGGQ